MSRWNLTRLARRALAIAVLATAAAAATPTTVIAWVESAEDKIDVPFVRDCHGVLRHSNECPPQHRPAERTALH